MNYFKSALAILLVTVSSCQALKPAIPDAARPIPVVYNSGNDTTNSVSTNWKEFFSDRYLTQLIDTALVNNWDLQIALQRIEAAKANVLLNRGAMAPALRALTSAGINKYGAYTMDGAGNMTTPIYDGRIVPDNLPNYFIGIQASWEADVWGKLKNRKKAAVARFLASVEGKNVVITNLVAEVASAYYELLALDAQLAIIDETLVLQENALEIVKVQKEAAVTTELAVEQFEAQLDGLRSLRLGVVMQIIEYENKINLLMGRTPQAIVRENKLSTLSMAHVHVGIPAALLQNRPDIRQAEAELIATKADIKAAKAAFYPSLTITAATGFEAFKTALLFTTPQSFTYGLLGGLAAPLLNRSALNSDLRRVSAGQQEALLNYQKSITQGFTEVHTEMQRINNLEQVYELKTKQVTTLTRAIETSSDLFKTGRSSYLEVLVTQQNALQSRLERVATRKSQFQATVNIYKALGGGWR